MKYKLIKIFFILKIFIYFTISAPATSKFHYAEQWYVIFNNKIQKKPENYKRNIIFLQNALKYPFGNPQYSLTKIETKEQWNKYKLLFKMHVNLLLVKQNLYLGDLFDTRHVFFLKPRKNKEILLNLKKSENLYKLAAEHYNKALRYHKKLQHYEFIKIQKDGITNWEDEYHKITLKKLDYYDIIEKELIRIKKTKEFFNQT